ncbi:hypothetical protein LSTR_LSTR006562 [Laodelphax striatellus]|uniref:Protocadherin-like wing polarity protein stan n=1 Tax=Laodelphax striatellus TaxID=195883 RepID=A0A482WVA5_LAOST|nr:hypothetical protein LSTR_LSTR006562 [Laodelphax striatellus]
MDIKVVVTINIEDVNDSPPAFESDKLTLYIAENSPVGSTVGEILAIDPDEGPNAVVHYSIIGGEDSNSFSLVRRPHTAGAELLTMVELDYESSHKRYELVIRAASPPLRTDVHVEVLVTDVNDNAPVLKNFQVIFNNFKDCFPAGAFGQIPASDADVTDRLHFNIISGNNANLVQLNQSTGMLSLSPQLNTNVPKVATMEISVTDGVNEVKSTMQLLVRLVTDEMLFSSITVRLGDMTEEAFLSPLLGFFVEGLAAIIPCPKDNIFVFSIQDDTDVNARILNVSFSARRPDGQFYPPQYLQERVYLNRGVLARLATVQVLPFDDNLCVREPCLNFEQCLTVLKFGNASGFISSDTVLFRPIYPVSTFACRCPEGFTGSREHYLCDTEVNLCYSYPCQNEGTCYRSEGGYTCSCKPGFAGRNCEIDLSVDQCKPGICHSGSTCSPLVTGGFVCDDCAPSGTFEHYNQLCQLRGRSFPKNSFLTFPSLKQRHRLHVSMKFATLADSGLLLYNGRYNEQHDFIALEIVESGAAVQFSFSLGSDVTRVAARLKTGVNDGNWHRVTVDYFNKTATISLDDCDTALTIKYGEKLGETCANRTVQILESRCAILFETCHRFLDLTGPLQIGGLPSLPSSTTFQVRSKDFVGCIADLHIDHKLIDLNTYVADNGTVIGCPQRKSYCVSEPCFNGGTCSDDWGTFHCDCVQGWSGKDCSQSISPAWRFHGDSLLSFNPLLRPILLPWLVGISVRTLQSTAFLMSVQVGQNSSAVLSLDGGMVVFTLDSQRAVLVSAKINDGKWHRIEVNWNVGGVVTLTLDNGRRSAAKTLNAKLQGLYVGRIAVGSTEDDLDKKLGFNGCIQDVRIGTSQSILQRATVKVGVTDGCMDSDPCSHHSCTPHSHCVPDWERYSCQCESGFVGPTCKSVCDINPCDHESECVEDRNEVRGYKCMCNSTSFTGEYCEEKVSQICPATWWGKPVCGPCRCDTEKGYAADCNKTTGECYCRENHYQPPGSDYCLPCNCYPTGSYGTDCDSVTGQCRCRTGVLGLACDLCPNPVAEVTLRGCEVVYDGCPRNFAGGLWWSRTKFGEEAIENCPTGSQGKASRICDDATGEWLQPNVFNCTSDKFVDLRRLLTQLQSGDVGITTFVAVEASNTLQKATNQTENLFGADVLITEQIIDRLLLYEATQMGLNLTHSQDKDYIQNIVSATSEVVNEKHTNLWFKIEELTGENAETLLFTVENYLKTLALNQRDTFTDPFETISENMVLGLDVVTYESLFGYESESLSLDVFPGSSGKETEKVIIPDTSNIVQPLVQHVNLVGTSNTPSRSSSPAVIFPKYNNYVQDLNKFDKYSHVMIPVEMLGIKQNKIGEHKVKGDNSGQAIIGYAQYKTLGKVLPMRYDMTVVSRWGVDLIVASPVFTLVAIVMDEGVHSLSDSNPLPAPVRFRLWLNEEVRSPRANPQCVHWTNSRGFGEWSRAGCHTELPQGNWWKSCGRFDKTCKSKGAPPVLINCTCNHLSSFAVIVDLINDDYLIETSVGEEVATWVGFCLALWALAMATFMLSILRAKTNSSAIYTNQALTLLLGELLFLIALKARSSLVASDVPCKLIAMALHYIWLCALSWWLVGSIHLYRMLTEVRDVNHGPMRFYYCLGYSLPAVIVCLAIGVRTDQYGNIFFCWLSLYESVIWSMIGPACLIISANLLVLMFSLRAAFTVKDHVAGYGNLRRLLWLNVVSLPLVTACWLLCLISASEHDPSLTYALSVTVVTQAWFLLFGYCLSNARVRSSIYRLMLQMIGRKVPPLDNEDDEDDYRNSATQRNLQPPTRSALAYRSGGAGGGGGGGGMMTSQFEAAARRHIGISTSSTTSRSTTKTGSSPYRSDTQLRQTSTSTSNYDQSASDVPGSIVRQTQHTSDSESEVSASGRSLDLASSHSSDCDEAAASSSRHRGDKRRQPTAAATDYNLPPNIRCDSGASIQPPPPQLNIIANSELFKPIYAPRWPTAAGAYSTVEQVALDESFIPHRWTNMSGSTNVSDSDMNKASTAHEQGLNLYYSHHPREPSLSDADDKSNLGEKYLFPYTAEEDHCPTLSSNGLLHRPAYSSQQPPHSRSHSHSQLSDYQLPPLRASPYQQLPLAVGAPPLSGASSHHQLASSPSPLLMHPHDFACPDISETDEDDLERYE